MGWCEGCKVRDGRADVPTSRVVFTVTVGDDRGVRRVAVGPGGRDERRWGEALGLKLFAALGPLLPRRYRIAPAERIAATLLAAVREARPGVRIVESEAI